MLYNSKIRGEIKNIVIGSFNHPSAEDVYKELLLRGYSASISTVYRNLHQLSEEGLILELVMPNGKIQYDGKLTKHHHAYCIECKKIFDFEIENDKIKTTLNEKIGIDTLEYHILARGICKECQRKKQKV